MRRWLIFLYGALCYVLFLGTFLYAAGFMASRFVPKSVDSGEPGPLGAVIVTVPPCPGGGIGRRAWFRSMSTKVGGGSSPLLGTTFTERGQSPLGTVPCQQRTNFTPQTALREIVCEPLGSKNSPSRTNGWRSRSEILSKLPLK